jgi:hypothetical protein
MDCDPTWHLLCQLENGLYAFYQANTSYTDFAGGWGGMSLCLAPEPQSLVFFAMCDSTYSRYEQGTRPAWTWDAATAERRLAWAMLGHARLGAARAVVGGGLGRRCGCSGRSGSGDRRGGAEEASGRFR